MTPDGIVSGRDLSYRNILPTDEKAVQNACQSGDLDVLQLLIKVWPLALVATMVNIYLSLETHVFMPFLYTRVSCCQDGEQLGTTYDAKDPELMQSMHSRAVAMHLNESWYGDSSIPACAIPGFPPGSSLWSLSASCTNKAFVQDSAQSIMARMKPTQKIVAFLILPVGGAIADSIGRMPVLVVYAGCLALACMLLGLDASQQSGWTDSLVYVAGCFVGICFQPAHSVIASTVADVVGYDDVQKGRAMMLLQAFGNVANLMITIGMYWLMRLHLSNYFFAWLALGLFACCIIAVLFAFMPETLPPSARTVFSIKLLDPVRGHLRALAIIAKDEVLILHCIREFVFYMHFLGFLCCKTSYLTSVGFRLEETLLPEILSHILVLLCATPSIKRVLPYVGIWQGSVLASLSFAASYAFFGPFTVLVSLFGPYLASPLMGLGIFWTFSLHQSIASQRSGPADQAKVQATTAAIGTLGVVVGLPLYRRYLFSATAQGLAKANVPIVSMILALLNAVISEIIAWRAKATEGFVVEEMPTELVDETATGALTVKPL